MARRMALAQRLILAGLALVVAACTTGGSAPGAALNLSEAVAAGDVDAVRSLLNEGADPELPLVGGLTPLMRASARDDSMVIEALVAGGADVNAPGLESVTALHIAAELNADRAVQTLLGMGAEVAARSANGMNALDHAAAGGGVAVMRTLVDAGLDPNAPSNARTQGHGYPVDTGPPPLSIAVRSGNLDGVEMLLTLGADIDGLSRRGQSALLTAVLSNQSTEIVDALLAHGADTTVETSCESGCSVDGSHDALGWAEILDRQALIPSLEAARS